MPYADTIKRREASKLRARRYRERCRAKDQNWGKVKRRDFSDIFWEKTCRLSCGCVVWTRGQFNGGYGAVQMNGKLRKAHRVAWELVNGPIPDGLLVCHTCDVPECVNPGHLFLGSPKDNSQDALKKDRLAKGEDCGRARMTPETVLSARAEYESGATRAALSRKHGITHYAMTLIVMRKTWRHI